MGRGKWRWILSCGLAIHGLAICCDLVIHYGLGMIAWFGSSLWFGYS